MQVTIDGQSYTLLMEGSAFSMVCKLLCIESKLLMTQMTML